MKTFRKLSLAFAATIIIAADANAGRWLSRDPIEEGAGFVQRDPIEPISIVVKDEAEEIFIGYISSRRPHFHRTEPNIYGFVRNSPVDHVDLLGLRSSGTGAGQLCVDKNCKAKDLASMRYLSEDDNTKLLPLPAPGKCVDADAFYAPGFAWKIPDNGKITIVCDKDGCLTEFKYNKWPWWIGSGPQWEPGKPKPPKWPGDIPPYENDPPK